MGELCDPTTDKNCYDSVTAQQDIPKSLWLHWDPSRSQDYRAYGGDHDLSNVKKKKMNNSYFQFNPFSIVGIDPFFD